MIEAGINPVETLRIDDRAYGELPRLAGPLLEWYDKNARDLPWRWDKDPYRVWISEIMLQQTRVEAVKGYYLRFLEAAPDVERLAALPERELLSLWEGLGYYSRARNLQKAAQALVERRGGRLPASYEALLELPGIGEYTAGAIASISFGIPVPAVDGNVYRVLSRALGSFEDITKPAVKRAYREAAARMQSPERPGDFNQALMELGATVCLPKGEPKCPTCPLSGACTADEEGTASELPVKPSKKPRRVELRTILILRSGGEIFLQRRGRGLLSGMYEPVNLEGHLGEEEIPGAVAALGGAAKSVAALGAATHIFSHVEWRMTGYRVECRRFASPEGEWVSPSDRSRYPIPSAFKELLAKSGT